MLHDLLFPSLKGSWGKLDFAKESLAVTDEPNPFLDPEFCGEWVKKLHARDGIDFSYGGYLEDRSNLWRGHYMKPGYAYHLGIDYNVPVGTPVQLPFNAALISSVMDKDQNGGWGGKAIFKRGDKFMIFGHLASEGLANAVGLNYKIGQLVGHVGETFENGNWFPHLHVQVVAGRNEPRDVDGYGKLYSGIEADFPNPESAF